MQLHLHSQHEGDAQVVNRGHQRKRKGKNSHLAKTRRERAREEGELCEEARCRRKAGKACKAHGNTKRHERMPAAGTLDVFEVLVLVFLTSEVGNAREGARASNRVGAPPGKATRASSSTRS